MRPCFFINDLQKGGAERLVKDLAIRIEKYDQVDPTVIVSNDVGELKPELLENNIRVVSLNVDVKTSSIPEAAYRLSILLPKLDADIVHSHLPFSHIVSRLACRYHSIPHIATYHNVKNHKTILKRIAERTTRHFSERIICVSKGVRQSYLYTNRMIVIYNSIDVEKFHRQVSESNRSELVAKNGDEIILLNVARCVKQKRQHDLIKAMSLLEIDNVHLYIVGKGPYRESLEKLTKKIGVSDSVTVTGYVESIEPYFATADAFVSSSSREGFPTTHLEAMAAELPIVSTDIPGVREVVDHGRTGLLTPPKDPERLSKTIADILEDPERMGQAGYKKVRNEFDLEIMTKSHYSLYDDLIH